MATCEICNDGKDYKNLGAHKSIKHDIHPVSPETIRTVETKVEVNPEVVTALFAGIMESLKKIDTRISGLEIKAGGRDDTFKKGIKSEDIINAEVTRKNVDEKIVKIVDELLGEDFGIDIETRQDQPGFYFTLIVPRRLSDLTVKTRPAKGEDGQYKRDSITQSVLEEEYYPEDRRSRAISSYQSYDAIRAHCEKVRSYLVSYYQKLQRPIPEFKLRQYT